MYEETPPRHTTSSAGFLTGAGAGFGVALKRVDPEGFALTAVVPLLITGAGLRKKNLKVTASFCADEAFKKDEYSTIQWENNTKTTASLLR